MFKRPQIRVRDVQTHVDIKPPPGSLLFKIINPEPTVFAKHVVAPIFKKDAYLNLLKKNYIELGLEYKDLNIPDEDLCETITTKDTNPIDYIDKIFLRVKILKNGTIKIKIISAFKDLYDKYYSQAKKPPIKLITSAYKSMGFSTEFIDKILANHASGIAKSDAIFKKIDGLLTKESTKKVVKKKKETKKQEDDEIIEEQEEEDDEEPTEDDGGMDVEIDIDDEDLGNPEEEYFSDGE